MAADTIDWRSSIHRVQAGRRICANRVGFAHKGCPTAPNHHAEKETELDNIESARDDGSMYGVVDSLRNATEAMRQLERFLPDDFMWPTGVHASPGKVTVEWAQAPLRESGSVTLGDSVWLVATPVGVTMHAIFHQEYPHVTGVNEEFKAEAMAELLIMLTGGWSWEVMKDGTATWSSPTAKRRPSADRPVSDLEQESSGTNLSGFGLDTISCRVGSLEVRGRGVPRMSAIWNNPNGKSSVAILVPFTDEVETWVNGIVRNNEEGNVRSFEVVYEDADKTAQLVMSGEGGVWPHPFGRNGVVAIVITDIPYLHRKAINLTQSAP